ncbi:MAG: sulfite reductase subunit alpha [Verrucomicrobia bacterium]|nr:sulfite reductase subunit alpha [Verrucomicrobiota bacterium]
MSTTLPAPPYSRKNPFPAKLLVNQKLTLVGSEKETRHYEFCLEGSGLQYEPGDSMGIFPKNNPKLVEEVLHALHFSGDEQVTTKEGQTFSLRQGLLENFHITSPSKQFLELIAERSASATELKELMLPERKQDLEHYLWGMEIIDFLSDNPSVRITIEEFVGTLRKLQPRLYSIASSLKAHPEQVHFLIATVRYESHGRSREGVASTYLADRLTEDVPVPMFVHVAKGFRLPDPTMPAIMVGPGTGLAPFRAYLEERRETGATGKNWLFFGEQRHKCDFFYREEMEQMQKLGVLTRFDTAFSRDQAHKIYVQHRLMEHSKELFAWLEQGAHFFVCGDAARMAKDVDVALHQIIEREGDKTPEQAAEYVENLRKEKRYKRDVY